MAFAVDQPVPWTVPPDWTGGIRERLAWLTEILKPRKGIAQKRKLRIAPRRSFDFTVIADGRDRRALDALLFDQGGRTWELPIWHDLQILGADLASGASSIPCLTDGYDFVDGGRALLWLAVNVFELVTIDTVEVDGLTLVDATTQDWPAHARLYPVRRARNADWPQESAYNDVAGKRVVSFQIDEPCDWPPVAPEFSYRDYPVVEWRSDETEDPTAKYERTIDTVDVGTGSIAAFDWQGRPSRQASHRWIVGTREQNSALRSRMYWFAGRFRNVWLPSWSADLQLVEPVASDSVLLVVDWCGYTLFGKGQSNRRDIRIELLDGTFFYRRITTWAEAGETEQLTIDSALGVDVAVAAVRVISFMTLSEQASDTVELQHETDADGVTLATTAFSGVVNDV